MNNNSVHTFMRSVQIKRELNAFSIRAIMDRGSLELVANMTFHTVTLYLVSLLTPTISDYGVLCNLPLPLLNTNPKFISTNRDGSVAWYVLWSFWFIFEQIWAKVITNPLPKPWKPKSFVLFAGMIISCSL